MQLLGMKNIKTQVALDWDLIFARNWLVIWVHLKDYMFLQFMVVEQNLDF